MKNLLDRFGYFSNGFMMVMLTIAAWSLVLTIIWSLFNML